MKSAASVNYVYDGDGRRVQKSSGKLYWYGMGSDALLETDPSGNLTNEYVFFNGKRTARRDSSSNVFYYIGDHLSTSRVITTSGGATCYESDFQPFGTEGVTITNTCAQNYKFTGKERDSESGLDNFGARYYSSPLGHFISPDWSARPTSIPAAEFNNPQSLNLYAYVRNNPGRNVDPDGHEVKVDDDKALQRLRSTLPSDVQASVNLDKNGNVDKSILNVKSDDPNVKALQALVKSSGTLELKTANSVNMGKYGKTEFFFQSAAAYAAELKSKGITIDSKSAIDQLFLGKTDIATQTASGKNVLVTISDAMGKAATAPGVELAVTTAHEMYGHGLLQLQVRPWEHDNHGPVDAAIVTIEQNTRKTYEKNQQ